MCVNELLNVVSNLWKRKEKHEEEEEEEERRRM